ncbi:thioredoxin reductase 1, cytoplasmic-like [Lytechinus variegatus]|uniref:thioredoxin reductase 1, cytoplasmic-like n=1 Tax=Lytechinus variegatus TaxID=7654 RepID=UPI001BB1181F|nr:thioredoxin reductase 1, cytoplasmic-like [Lytechinus variegatus]
MAPVARDQKAIVLDHIQSNDVMIFSKSYCPFCVKVKELFNGMNIKYKALELDLQDDGAELQEALLKLSGQKTVPNVYIKGTHIGGCDDTFAAKSNGKINHLLNVNSYDYDLIVIGGGSGGLAASKEAAVLGKKVAVCDFVKPTPKGTTWGLGGTCVNVGCIPKKLMHQAAILGESLQDSRHYGWETPESVQHSWSQLRDAVQAHVGSLNWGYKVALREKDVTYINGYAAFVDAHTIKTVNKKGKEQIHTAERFLIATGMRPRYPDIPGSIEYTITSDDLFSLPYNPGKTVCVGASYVSLECAGFLAGMGNDVTVMVRSILLRGFDQDMAEKIGSYMEKHHVNFIRKAVPTKIEMVKDGQPPTLRIHYKKTESGDESTIECNTILMAIGRDACTTDIGLDKVGVITNTKNGKIPTTNEQTNVPHIYAVGDILQDGHELTPVAIEAGKLLARRLYNNSNRQCDYVNVPTTVFTPLEYGSCGLPEEDAVAKYGQENLEVYHTYFQPLEYTVSHREANACYAKIICDKSNNEKVVGFHVLGPNAGEMTQGFAVAMKAGATKEHFDSTIGIHPTCGELFTTMKVTKSSGEDITPSGC